MVLSFFRKSSAGLDTVVSKSIAMLNDARHSFDLAAMVVVSGGDAAVIADDVRSTDERINEAERDLRNELVVHTTVHGAADIGEVMGLILLLKKIERIGDQAKNILDLAESGVSFSGDDDSGELTEQRQVVSMLFAEAADLLASPDDDTSDFVARSNALSAEIQGAIEGFLTSDRPGHEVVPRAIYARYLKRVVANLIGVVRAATEPISRGDSADDAFGDLDD